MSVAKWKQEIDRKIRQSGGTVVGGRVYNGCGAFWGPRVDFVSMSADMQRTCLEAFARQAQERRATVRTLVGEERADDAFPVTVGNGRIVHLGWKDTGGAVARQTACGAATPRSGVRVAGGAITCRRCLSGM